MYDASSLTIDLRKFIICGLMH